MLRNKIKRAASSYQAEPDTESNPKKKLIKQPHKSSQTSAITSPFFGSMQLWQKVYDIECRLSAELKTISFLSSIISAVYNPIEYAADLHCAYLKKFLNAPKPVLFIGMNPGPFGMVQTGVKKLPIHNKHVMHIDLNAFARICTSEEYTNLRYMLHTRTRIHSIH